MSKSSKFAVGLFAESLVKGLQISALPVNPMNIARNRGIEVVPKPIDHVGCSGMLLRVGEEFAIAYSTHLQNEGFENFSVAHELGHYFLPDHANAVTRENGFHTSRAGYSSNDKYEREADQFAASFLMPRYLFFPELIKTNIGLDAIIKLSNKCKTSIHATAIRYTECAKEPIAAIISRNNIIDHCFMSSALKNITGVPFIKFGQKIQKGTVTYTFNSEPDNIVHASQAQGISNMDDWFGVHKDIQVREDVIGLGNYGKTLTIIYDIEMPDEEDEEDERRLNESWIPKFK